MGEVINTPQYWLENLRGLFFLEDLAADGKIITKLIDGCGQELFA
jgi:hypothetical protein